MEYIIISEKQDMSQYLPALKTAKVLAVDTETTGLNPHTDRVRLIQLAAEGLPVLIIDCFSFLPNGIDMLSDIFGGSNVKVFQNAKFDLQFLMALGIYPYPIFDTMLAGQLLRSSGGPSRMNLAALALHYLNINLDKSEQKSDWTGDLTQLQLKYAARDVEILLRLREAMVKELYVNNLSAIARIEFSCVRAVAEMEYTGISLNGERWKELITQTEREREESIQILYTYAGEPDVQLTLTGEEVVLGHNFDSNPYILHLLRANGINADATSKRVLSAYSDHPLIQALKAYRKAAKALSGFLYPIPHMIHSKTQRLHPRYGQIGAWSGRMCCAGPNIQQIPRDLSFRACFVAVPGKKLIIADYSQIELRVVAQISGDKRMINAYRNGDDLHALTASLVSEISIGSVTKTQRQAAKAVNFGLIFGMGAAGLQQYAQQSYGVDMTLEQATKFRNNFSKAYTGIAEWHRRVRNEKPTEGRTLTGRKFTFGENAGLSGLYNTPVQGTAADIMKAALGELAHRTKGTVTKIIAAVHDEIMLEADEGDAETAAVMLKAVMEQTGNSVLKDVPCVAEVEISDTWAGKG
jgi:DNA polymerase-1